MDSWTSAFIRGQYQDRDIENMEAAVGCRWNDFLKVFELELRGVYPFPKRDFHVSHVWGSSEGFGKLLGVRLEALIHLEPAPEKLSERDRIELGMRYRFVTEPQYPIHIGDYSVLLVDLHPPLLTDSYFEQKEKRERLN